MKLVLASASPRRHHLMRDHGWMVELAPPSVEEVKPDYLTVAEITLLNARRKAVEVAARNEHALVIAADTLVAHEDSIFGKPSDMEEAFRMLRLLCGKTHQVYTGVWLHRARMGTGFIECSHVRFRPFTDSQIREYLERVEPLDKAGAYAAQENFMSLIEEITGSKTNVIGLPMERLELSLEALGAQRAMQPKRKP